MKVLFVEGRGYSCLVRCSHAFQFTPSPPSTIWFTNIELQYLNCSASGRVVAQPDIFAARTPLRRQRPLGDGSACSPIRLTLESLLTSELPRMELSNASSNSLFFTAAIGNRDRSL
jgi:hypothetical protein